MSHELTNLLPKGRRQALRREYFMRLAVVGILFLSTLVLVSAIFLVPTYLYLAQQTDIENERIRQLDESIATSGQRSVALRIQQLEADARHLARLQTDPKVSAALRAVLAVPRSGISLTGFTYAAGVGDVPAKMTVSGMATTRDALRQYQIALAAEPYIDNADLPISAYAAEREIPFTITLTGTLTP